jgi:pilus assembly protein CpaE
MIDDLVHLPPVVVVVSPKGGSGKTAIATNLAAAFARYSPTVLADLNMYSGDIEWSFGARPTYRLHDVARRLREDPTTELSGMFTLYGKNLSLLCAPDSHLAADGVSTADLAAITSRLISLQRPLVLDTAPSMNDSTIDALETASQVLLVANTDVASVHAARKLLDTMFALRLDTTRVMLAINRTTAKSGLGVDDIERRLGFAARLKVADHRQVTEGLNAGLPIVESHPDHAVSRSFVKLATSLLGVPRTAREPFWKRRSA